MKQLSSLRIFILFLLIIPNLGVCALNEAIDSCDFNKEILVKQSSKLIEMSEVRDITQSYKELVQMVRFYCPSKIRADINKLLTPYVSNGLKSHIRFMKEEAKRVSSFRPPEYEIKEIERARNELKQLGEKLVPLGLSSLVEKYYLQQGAINSKKRKTTCKDVDSRKPRLVELNSDGSIKRNIMRDQDSIGWCYAYTAADLISVEIGKRVSAVDVANSYNNGTFSDWLGLNESSMQGGYCDTAGNDAVDRGLCLESQLPSGDYHFSKGSASFIDELKAIESLYDIYQEYVSEDFLGIFTRTKSGDDLLRAQKKFKKDITCGPNKSDWQELFQNLNLDTFMKVIHSSSSSNDFIDKLVAKNCTPRLQLPKELELHEIDDEEEIWPKIDSQLESGKIAEVSYYSDVLYDKHDRDDGLHSSLIVARRFNPKTQSCEYMVRNSWGNGCASYDDSYDCLEGNIWIAEEYLKRATVGMVYAE